MKSIVSALVLAFCSSLSLSVSAKDTVKIAYIGPLTGGVSANGIGGRNSADLAVRLRNQDPNAKYKYELVSADDECKPNVGVQVATKIAADQLSYSFYSSFDLPLVIVRPFNTYGPRQSARAVIPTIITQLASGKRQIQLGAVSPTRDFNFVTDTVNGFIAALRSDGGLGEIINLGSNFEISIGDAAQLIAEAMGVTIEIITDEARIRPENSEVQRLWADNSKARDLLGWQPAYAGRDGFKRGLTETIAWFRQSANLRGYKSHIYNI